MHFIKTLPLFHFYGIISPNKIEAIIMSGKLYMLIHGCPHGQQSNATKDDPSIFRAYTERFHMGDNRYVACPSKPGAKFIKEELPNDYVAYTYVHTGVHEAQSDRPGSNYAAITLFFPKSFKISNEKEFQQKLQQWFETNIINNFTYKQLNNWHKWTPGAEFSLFSNKYDTQIVNAIGPLASQYLTTTNTKQDNTDTIKKINTVTENIKAEIQKLKQAEKEIQEQLAQKYSELEKLSNQKQS